MQQRALRQDSFESQSLDRSTDARVAPTTPQDRLHKSRGCVTVGVVVLVFPQEMASTPSYLHPLRKSENTDAGVCFFCSFEPKSSAGPCVRCRFNHSSHSNSKPIEMGQKEAHTFLLLETSFHQNVSSMKPHPHPLTSPTTRNFATSHSHTLKLLQHARCHLLHTTSTTTFHCPSPRLPPVLSASPVRMTRPRRGLEEGVQQQARPPFPNFHPPFQRGGKLGNGRG